MAPIPVPSARPQESERCDAARNRASLLNAAADLVAERGVDAITMDAVAARAGVGKGTVFRRFGSRSGLMQALLDHTETEFQQRFMFGPPPLGPGANPVERLVAYGRGRLAAVEVQGDLLRAVESSPELRFGSPARQLSLHHVLALLREARVPGDLPVLAHSLLAPLEASLVLHQVRDLAIPVDRIAAAWEDLTRRVTLHDDASARH